MTFLFSLLIVLGLMGLDWHFNVLPILSETFSYENYDFFKSWKNAKDGVGGVQVRQSVAFVLKCFPLRALSNFSDLVKALNQQMVPPVSTGDISGLHFPCSTAHQGLGFQAGEPAHMLRSRTSCQRSFQLHDHKRGKKKSAYLTVSLSAWGLGGMLKMLLTPPVSRSDITQSFIMQLLQELSVLSLLVNRWM